MNKNQFLLEDIKIGLEALYLKFTSGKTLKLTFNDSHETTKVNLPPKVELSTDDYLQSILTERFVRFHCKQN